MMYAGTEPVGRGECLSLNLRDSAPVAPFQSINGVDAYPTLYDKAACLFFSIVCGHIFTNGNKRTAVLALNIFLLANERYLLFSEDEIVDIARQTASHSIDGRSPQEVKQWLSKEIEEHSISFDEVKQELPESYNSLVVALESARQGMQKYS